MEKHHKPRNIENKFKKLMVVFRNTKYYSRNFDEGPTDTNHGMPSKGKDASNPYIRLLKTVVVFYKTSKAYRNMIVVFKNTDNYFRKKYENSGKKDKGLRNMVVTFRSKSHHL
ncbi:MAG TPA: hypothetical protein DCL77_21125 [Prolixibacteraceae bacterium]|jgi:hypothetical protein|nr:hypothetical protein [Prolixibacteraceae bacterium]